MRAIFSVLFVVILLNLADSDISQQEILDIIQNCARQHNLDKSYVTERLNAAEILDEENKFIPFFKCYATSLGIVKNEEIDYDRLKVVLIRLVQQKLGTVEDVGEKAEDIAVKSINECKGLSKAENIFKTLIQLRNRIKKVIKDKYGIYV